MDIFIYPIANSTYTHPWLFNPSKTTRDFHSMYFSLHSSNTILLVAQAKNPGVIFEVPSLLHIPHNLPANPVILFCDIDKSCRSMSPTGAMPPSWSHQYFFSWTCGVASKWHPFLHSSHSCSCSCLFCSKSSTGVPSHSESNPNSIPELLYFTPSTFLIFLLSILPHSLGSGLWSPHSFLNIPSMLPLQSLCSSSRFLCLDFSRYPYYVFPHYI